MDQQTRARAGPSASTDLWWPRKLNRPLPLLSGFTARLDTSRWCSDRADYTMAGAYAMREAEAHRLFDGTAGLPPTREGVDPAGSQTPMTARDAYAANLVFGTGVGRLIDRHMSEVAGGVPTPKGGPRCGSAYKALEIQREGKARTRRGGAGGSGCGGCLD